MTANIYTIIDQIRPRPAMYLGRLSVTSLENFLSGYAIALQEFNIEMTETPSFYDFHDWVAMKLGYYESTGGWCRMLLEAENQDEEKALERFFLYLDEFRQRQPQVLLSATPDPTRIWHYKIIDIHTNEKVAVLAPALIQIVKYTDDGGVFVKYLDQDGQPLDRESYCQDLDDAFFWIGSVVRKEEWQ